MFNRPSNGITLTGVYKQVKFYVWKHKNSDCFEIRVAPLQEVLQKGDPNAFDPKSARFSQLPSVNGWERVNAILSKAVNVLESDADFWAWFNSCACTD